MGRKQKPGGAGLGVKLSQKAKTAITKWTTDNDEELGKTVSKILLWFVKTNSLIQSAILSRAVRETAPFYAEALRRLADEIEHGYSDKLPVCATEEESNALKSVASRQGIDISEWIMRTVRPKLKDVIRDQANESDSCEAKASHAAR